MRLAALNFPMHARMTLIGFKFSENYEFGLNAWTTSQKGLRLKRERFMKESGMWSLVVRSGQVS